MAEGVSDIVHRLRSWAHAVHAVPASDIMDEAAAEIERLSGEPCPHVVGTVTRYCTLTPLTLTDAEREAVRKAADAYAINDDDAECAAIAATLRGLLERLK